MKQILYNKGKCKWDKKNNIKMEVKLDTEEGEKVCIVNAGC